MANPFLVLGGIAISVATAAFGILQVPGWVASAQDAAAINDLSNIRSAEAAVVSTEGKYVGGLDELQSASGLKFALSDGVTLSNLYENGDDWCGVVQSASGTYFAATAKAAGHVTGETEVEAAAAAGCSRKTTAVFTFNLPADSRVRLPLQDAEGEILWSDGVHQDVSGDAPLRDAKAGALTAEFKGTFKTLSTQFDNVYMAGGSYVTGMPLWDEASGTTSAYWGLAMSALVDAPASIPSTVKSLDSVFINAAAMNDPDVSSWDVSNVEVFKQAFSSAHGFTQDISGWDMSGATSIEGMFWRKENLHVDVSDWDVSNVKNMRSVFRETTGSAVDLSGWDTSEVTDMSRVFDQSKLPAIGDISGWKTGKVEDMERMFYGTGFPIADLSTWDTSKVVNMSAMFRSASKFTHDISNWDVSKVAKYENFNHLGKLTESQLPKWVL